jgi:hypothetical protein
MSQSGATARAAARAPTRGVSARQQLRVVSPTGAQPRGGLFAALCVLLLGGGLLAVLMLNTALAQGSFQLHDLNARSGELADTQEALSQAIDAERAPAQLAQQARALGMVPADSAAFLRLSDGMILGVAKPARRSDFAVMTLPVPARPARPSIPAPKRTVVTKGDVTITTVITVRRNGAVVTTVTTVNAKTRTTSTKTTVAPPPTPTGGDAPAAGAGAVDTPATPTPEE